MSRLFGPNMPPKPVYEQVLDALARPDFSLGLMERLCAYKFAGADSVRLSQDDLATLMCESAFVTPMSIKPQPTHQHGFVGMVFGMRVILDLSL